MEYEQFQDSGSLDKPLITCSESGAKFRPGAAVLLGSSLKALQANPPEALAWRAACLLATGAESVWQPRPPLRFSPFPKETSTLLVPAELSWHHGIVRGCQELPKPRAAVTLPPAFSSSNPNPSKTNCPRSPLHSSNLPRGLKINKNLTRSNESNE